MAKYDPLRRRLEAEPKSCRRLVLSFAELDELVGGLPASARRWEWFWDNEDPAETRHVHSKAWMETGWRVVDVELGGERVIFGRA